ncbi:MAG: hypothetical protein IPJ77_00340 [Planctomycetes bacterium]|nr:hypothetical protein [Planctomycetota bacterium]
MITLRSLSRVAAFAFALASIQGAPASAAPAQLTVVAPQATGAPTSSHRPPMSATLTDAQVDVVAWSAWPEMLYQGLQPLVFELTNRSEDERTIDLSLARGWGDDRWTVEESVTVAAGARERLELFAPVARSYDSAYTATIRSRGETTYINNLGANQPPNPTVWPVIYVHTAARTPQAGAVEVWGAALGSITPEGLPHQETPEPPMVRVHMGGVGPMPIPAATTATSSAWSVAVTAVPVEELPARFEPYTSLKGVILDAQGALPRSDVLDALLAWTRLGGCLVFQGPEARAKALAVPGAAAWIEERFLLSASGADAVYACGQGALVLAGSADVQTVQTIADAPRHASAIETIGRGLVHGVSFASSPQHEVELASLPGLSGLDLPYRALTLLLVLFAIVIGPVNLIVVQKLKRPALLLVTVPLIALVFSVGLFAYGAVSQGLGTRARSHSITWLDQRTHGATTLEVRSLFAGMPAGDGWRPGPGVACVALPHRSGSTGQLRLDFREGLAYTGDYLPVRREVREAFLVDRAARARLSLTRNGERITVENGLGAGIASLVLRDADGDWHVSTGRIDAGARAELEPVTAANLAMDRVHETLASVEAVASVTDPFTGTYVARLEASAFVDACGVEYAEEESVHVVFGVLESEGGGR